MSTEAASQSILEKLRDILRDNAVEDHDWDAVGLDTGFEAIGIDSLSILDLLYDVDQAFGIQLEAKDVVDMRTVGEIVETLKTRGAS